MRGDTVAWLSTNDYAFSVAGNNIIYHFWIYPDSKLGKSKKAQNTERLGRLIRFLFLLSAAVSKSGSFAAPRREEGIAGCVTWAMLCWTGVVGVDVRGVELADSLRERFWREMTAESKTVNHIVNYIPDKHLHIYIPALYSSKSEFSKKFHSSPSLRSNPSGVQ